MPPRSQNLFEYKVQRIYQLSPGEPVPIGACRPFYFDDIGGGVWIGKSTANMAWSGLCAEIVAGLLGQQIGARVPPFAVSPSVDETVWLSSLVNDVQHWSATASGRIANINELGAMVALDAIIANSDRNLGNILVQPTDDGSGLIAWAIDHEKARIGRPGELLRDGLISPEPRGTHAKPFLVDAIEEAAHLAADLASALPHELLHSLAQEAAELAKLDDYVQDELERVLVTRCRGARQPSWRRLSRYPRRSCDQS